MNESAVPVIHAVTDDLIVTLPGFLIRARAVMLALGARGAVHLRGRSLPAARMYEIACALEPIQERTGCWMVVNDRVDLALAAGARGAQLTSRSMAVPDAQRVIPGQGKPLALGASVHDAVEAAAAERAGADWVVAGHVFTTPSHPGDTPRGAVLVREIRAATSIPCFAIGGIKPVHVAALREAGAHGVAAIRGIWGADDAERAANDYLSAYDGDEAR